MGASFGVSIGVALMALLNVKEMGGIGIIIVLVAAIIGGILAIAMQKLILILATSFLGANGMVIGALMLVPGAVNISTVTQNGETYPSPSVSSDYTMIALIATLVVGVVGVLVQYRAGKKSN
jgi:hypothetical protein